MFCLPVVLYPCCFSLVARGIHSFRGRGKASSLITEYFPIHHVEIFTLKPSQYDVICANVIPAFPVEQSFLIFGVLNVKRKLSPPTASCQRMISKLFSTDDCLLLNTASVFRASYPRPKNTVKIYASLDINQMVNWLISSNSHSWFPSVWFCSCSPIIAAVGLAGLTGVSWLARGWKEADWLSRGAGGRWRDG